MAAQALEKLLKWDRAIVIAGLISIILLAWAYTIYLSARMTGMDEMSITKTGMPGMQVWQVEDFLFNLVMWGVMMIAMMTPSATPMILTYGGLNRRRATSTTPVFTTSAFLLGYLIIWFTFSAGATLLQWKFQSAGLLSPNTIHLTPFAGGILLIIAGIFQFTPLKDVCLANCRTPLSFLSTEWRDGTMGALVMGLRHGLYCLGCCWHLMLLLFVVGVMNLLWVAVIAGFVLAEKAMPVGRWGSRIGGLITFGWGIWLLFQGSGM